MAAMTASCADVGEFALVVSPFVSPPEPATCGESPWWQTHDSAYTGSVSALDDVIARIVKVAQPDRIILFGSAVRGTANADSDLDFLVIKRGVPNRRHLAQAIYRALVGVPVPVDIVVVTPEDVETFKDGVATIIGPALREGREVYAA